MERLAALRIKRPMYVKVHIYTPFSENVRNYKTARKRSVVKATSFSLSGLSFSYLENMAKKKAIYIFFFSKSCLVRSRLRTQFKES